MKRKTSITFGVIATIGVMVGGMQSLKDRPIKDITVKSWAAKNYRQALLDETCPTTVAAGKNCDHAYSINATMCMCTTDETETMVNEVENINTLPANRHFKFLVCENKSDSTNRFARWYPVTEGPEASEWRCETILVKGVKEKSIRNSRGTLLDRLDQRCCSSCSGDCFVSPGEWGSCPYCRLDNNCNTFCP